MKREFVQPCARQNSEFTGPQDDYMDVLLIHLLVLAHVMVLVVKSTRKRDRWGPFGQVACVICVKD